MRKHAILLELRLAIEKLSQISHETISKLDIAASEKNFFPKNKSNTAHHPSADPDGKLKTSSSIGITAKGSFDR
jgi:hypothetical protein